MVIDPLRVSHPELFEAQDKAKRMRLVSVTISYAQAATEQQIEQTGMAYTHIISPNSIRLPEQADFIEDVDLSVIRDAWVASQERIDSQRKIKIPHISEGVDKFVNAFFHKIGIEMSHASRAFIQAAEFPIPPEYKINLPLAGEDFRKELINAFVPFEGTKEMLLRLEGALDLPMRTIDVQTTRLAEEEALRRVMH